MTIKFYDRVRVSVASAPGTGSVALGAATSAFQSFSAAGASNGDTFPYLIIDGTTWEIGVGTYSTTGPTVSRTTFTASSSGSPISFTSSAIIMCAIRAEDMNSGGGALATLTDVSLSSPADGNLLRYNASASKWENYANPVRESVEFAPPQASWFDFSGSADTTTGTNYTGKGLYISAAAGTNSVHWEFGRRSTSAWGTSWTATARLRLGNLADRPYLNFAMGVQDSSGKLVAMTWGGNAGGNPSVLALDYYSNNTTYGGAYLTGSYLAGIPPELMRVAYDGTNLKYSVSWDGGLTWETYSQAATTYLSDHAYVLIGGQNFMTSESLTPSAFGVLCTYYDDPDHPASGHIGS